MTPDARHAAGDAQAIAIFCRDPHAPVPERCLICWAERDKSATLAGYKAARWVCGYALKTPIPLRKRKRADQRRVVS